MGANAPLPHPFPLCPTTPPPAVLSFPQIPEEAEARSCCIQAGKCYSSPWALPLWLGRMGPACLSLKSDTLCLPSPSLEHRWEGAALLPDPQLLLCCFPFAASPLLQPLASPLHKTQLTAWLVPAPPRPFLSGFVISYSRQGRDGRRGGGIRLGASSHNLCLTNLPPEGLQGAPPAPAPPHPSLSPPAAGTRRGMAARWGGGRERD